MRKNRQSIRLIFILVSLSAVLIWLSYYHVQRERLSHLLIRAVIAGDTQRTKVLLDRGADVNARLVLDRQPISFSGFVNLIRHRNAYVREQKAPTALMMAAQSAGQMNRFFIEEPYGELPHDDIDHALRRRFDKEAARIVPLTKKVAKGDIDPLDVTDQSDMVALLLDRGADVNAKDGSGRTALMYAAEDGHSHSVQLLLGKGADVNDRDKTGWTALAHAAWWGDLTTVRLLLAHGANVNAVDNEGTTILQIAEDTGTDNPILVEKITHLPELIKLLKQAGAK